MVSFFDRKIEMIEGINSNPIPPTTAGAGNITHFYQQYNFLIDELSNTLSNMQIDIGNLQTQVTDLTTRIETLEAASQANETTNNLIFENVNVDSGLTELTNFDESGTITAIRVQGASDIYSIYFSVNTQTITPDGWEIVANGLQSPVSGLGTTFNAGDTFSAYTSGTTETGITVELILA